eukprot:5485861-Pleurochrysis_carterae.AAC.3
MDAMSRIRRSERRGWRGRQQTRPAAIAAPRAARDFLPVHICETHAILPVSMARARVSAVHTAIVQGSANLRTDVCTFGNSQFLASHSASILPECGASAKATSECSAALKKCS